MSLSIWQILLVAVLFILLFGRGRIPALMGDLAEGIRSFKKGMADEPPPVISNPTTEQAQIMPGADAKAAKTAVHTGQQPHGPV